MAPDPDLSWPQGRRSRAGASQVTCQWLAAHRDSVRVVDVREPHEFHGRLGHIDGAELVPLARVSAATSGWPADQPVVCVCRGGFRSDRAAVAMERAGHRRVASLTGGMVGWNRDGRPIVRSRS